MKNYYLFPLLFLIISCKDIPKCDDENTINTVEEIGTLKNEKYINLRSESQKENLKEDLFYEFYSEKIEKFVKDYNDTHEEIRIGSNAYSMYYSDYDYQNDEEFKIFSSNFDDYLSGKTVDMNSEILDAFEVYRDSIYKPKLANIRTNSEDETSSSCGCSGNLEYNVPKRSKIKSKKEITYLAQKNSDGETYVEVYE